MVFVSANSPDSTIPGMQGYFFGLFVSKDLHNIVLVGVATQITVQQTAAHEGVRLAFLLHHFVHVAVAYFEVNLRTLARHEFKYLMVCKITQ